MVQETDQPYAFVYDDPLNYEDPIGLVPSTGTSETTAQTKAFAKAYAAAQAAAAKRVEAQQTQQAKTLTKAIVSAATSQDVQVTGDTASVVQTAVSSAISNPNNPISQSASTTILEDIEVGASTTANLSGVVGSVFTSYNDSVEGHGIAYSVGDGMSSWAAPYIAAESGAEFCSPLGPWASLACGLVAGGVAAYEVHSAW